MGKYLRNLRERKRKWLQREAAEACGWDQAKISKLETGERQASIDDLAVIAEVFGVPLNKLVRIRTRSVA